MSVSSTLVLIAVVTTFASMAITLAWAQLQTRHVTIRRIVPRTTRSPKRRSF
jgi:hypothetical protein